jgi:RNase P/RNase MRP subunit POP5
VKRVTDDAEKVVQLAIMFRNHALDWYIHVEVKNTQGVSGTVKEIKHAFIIDFQRPKLEDQFMNEMIEVRQKPGDSVWDID